MFLATLRLEKLRWHGLCYLVTVAIIEMSITKRKESRFRKAMKSLKNTRATHDESFKYAAVDFLNKNGNQVETVANELGIDPAELREWQKKLDAATARPARPLGGIAKLRAENEALRNEILQLQVQWDILKTTLGMLSTTVGHTTG